MKFLMCALIFRVVSLVAVGQTNYTICTSSNVLSFKAKYGDEVTLSVGQLFYKDGDGDTLPAADSYIVELTNGRYPSIVDGICGHDLSFQLSKIGGGGMEKLLVYYHAGGNAYHLRIYTLDGVDITPFKEQPGGSNMGSIKINKNEITVENQEFNNDDTTTLYTDTYRVTNDACKMIEEKKEILPAEEDPKAR